MPRQLGLVLIALGGLLFIAGGGATLWEAFREPSFNVILKGASEMLAGGLLLGYAFRRRPLS
jgi:hypothetical protein